MAHTPPGQTRKRVFQFVRQQLESGLSPSVREVRKALGFKAVQTAQEHLTRLVEEGLLAKRPGEARGYCLPTQANNPPTTLVPLLGQVQAGNLTTAIEEATGHIPFQTRSPQDLFALSVRGESMTGVGILPGDIAIVRSQPTADPGNIVVALVDDEATIKTLRIRKRRIELHPENPAFEPIVPPPDQVRILGKVIEVRRTLEGTS